MIFAKPEIVVEKPRAKKRGKGRLLCRQAQLDDVADKIRAMSEPEIITVVKTLREMGRI